MLFRLPALFLISVLVLAACSSTPPSTVAPTGIPPTSAPEPTSVPTSPIPATRAASSVPPLTPAPTPREIAYGKSYIGVHYCTDGDTPLTMNIVRAQGAVCTCTRPGPSQVSARFTAPVG